MRDPLTEGHLSAATTPEPSRGDTDADSPAKIQTPPPARLRTWEFPLLAGVAAVVLLWSWHALRIPFSYDIGLAYQGGRVAWRTGRPEQLPTWISTPFLGALLAVWSRVATESATAWLLSVVNIGLLWTGIVVVWVRLRRELPLRLWWVSLAGACTFAPAISSLWWKQLNLVALAFAVVSFVYVRRGRPELGGLFAALSIATKPIVLLLPLYYLVGRETRRAGVATIAWGSGLAIASLAFLALRAHDLGVVNPLPSIRNFSDKARPENIWVCHAENFSPQSTLCRLAGSEHWTDQRVVVTALVAVAIITSIAALWRRRSDDWTWFAMACLLSPMVSPIAWSHYQVLLAPMFVVLLHRLTRQPSPTIAAWTAVSFGLTMLVWQPEGSLPGLLRSWLGGAPETTHDLFGVFAVAMLAQYLLFFAAMLALAEHAEAGVAEAL